MPFVIALEPFHSASSLIHAIGPLGEYLYGRRDVAAYDPDGNLHLTGDPIIEHRHGERNIPSGLFSQPEASHLSAVLFTNSGTVNKFNRIGTERGYGPSDIAMIRIGTISDPNPNATQPQMFGYVVGDHSADERETFSEGIHVLHNPWAHVHLKHGALRGVNEHELLDDGRVKSTFSRLDPFASVTRIYQGTGAEQYARQELTRFLSAAE